MAPRPRNVSQSSYHPQQWSIAGIAREEQSHPSVPGSSVNLSLTVTLFYEPSQTLYAWPFNLSDPNAKGVCYETLLTDDSNGRVHRPPDATMSTSLRVLADVVRCWMRIRRERSALAKHRDSNGGITSMPNSPISSVDALVDNDEVIDEIIEALRLHQLTPFERSIHLLRQKLPEKATASAERSGSASSSSRSSPGSVDDQSCRSRSSSSASSRTSTAESSPDSSFRTVKTQSPKLPKINTDLPPSPTSPIPQIRLVEATPQEAEYEERDRFLDNAVPSYGRKSGYSVASMDTVHEDADEEIDNPTQEKGKASKVKVHPCDLILSEPTSPESPSSEATPTKSKSSGIPSPSKVFFHDPFNTSNRTSSKANDSPEMLELRSHDSLLASSSKSTGKSARRSSLDGLRSIFSARAKSQ